MYQRTQFIVYCLYLIKYFVYEYINTTSMLCSRTMSIIIVSMSMHAGVYAFRSLFFFLMKNVQFYFVFKFVKRCI